MNSGDSNLGRGRKQLGARDRRILDDVIRFRVLTNDLIQLLHMPEHKVNAVVKVTGRLVKTGWLANHPLIGRQQYFVVGNRTTMQFGLPNSRALPLGPQALSSWLSIANYCANSKPRLSVLDRSDFEREYRWMPEKSRSGVYARETADADLALRHIRVDLGGTPEHVARKCNRDSRVHVNISGFVDLIAQCRLVSVVLTSSSSKKRLIEAALKKLDWPEKTRFQVTVTSDLFQLLGS